ncbi:TPA: hypothetical protein LR339_001739 [Enterobacter hormaechei]|jgi:hypothetical protein|uniref:hypothetical protein n=1 Tax=Enterobacter hormaechei TaxID=158836 RepID=UPI000D6F2452|nr:hypothetical protein [Enterobacter hormaechei]ELR0644452.1 hypothetical protein [Enterobacter hormaechei]MCM7665006.1 hypothetical protein [Enterobacter hormaechei]PWU42503.1 hypothetical protein C7R95_03690 [Enterobacter hormaechei]HBL5329967.1 hypothetical protein [Enterobacter hormaechei]
MISYEVEFPTQKSFSLKINGYSSAEGLDCKTVEAIGGDVKVQLDQKTMLTVPYREDVTADFILEGYKQRAKHHAETVVSMLVEAAQKQTAYQILLGVNCGKSV